MTAFSWQLFTSEDVLPCLFPLNPVVINQRTYHLARQHNVSTATHLPTDNNQLLLLPLTTPFIISCQASSFEGDSRWAIVSPRKRTISVSNETRNVTYFLSRTYHTQDISRINPTIVPDKSYIKLIKYKYKYGPGEI